MFGSVPGERVRGFGLLPFPMHLWQPRHTGLRCLGLMDHVLRFDHHVLVFD